MRQLEVGRALVKRTCCLLEREEGEQQAALRPIEKLIDLFEARCGRDGPP